MNRVRAIIFQVPIDLEGMCAKLYELLRDMFIICVAQKKKRKESKAQTKK